MRKSAPLFCALLLSLSARRAWIEILVRRWRSLVCWSLSARRAWIEISRSGSSYCSAAVALRKESVDRNFYRYISSALSCWSLSARRAWIEIHERADSFPHAPSLSARRAWIEMALPELIPLTDPVALRKESVDRNLVGACHGCNVGSRSPQGERG